MGELKFSLKEHKQSKTPYIITLHSQNKKTLSGLRFSVTQTRGELHGNLTESLMSRKAHYYYVTFLVEFGRFCFRR